MAVQVAPTKTETLVTGDELLSMGDIGPSELVEGRIVLMGPTGVEHGHYEGNFHEHLKAFVRAQKLGKVVVGEVGVYIRRNPDTVRAADVAFISNERYAQRVQKRGFLDVAPDLVVEILSPDDRMQDMVHKLRDYFSIGVRLVWIAEPETKSVLAYRSLTDVREFAEKDDLPGDDVLPGFSVPVAKLFEE